MPDDRQSNEIPENQTPEAAPEPETDQQRTSAGLVFILWLSGIIFIFFGSWAFWPQGALQAMFNFYPGLGDELFAATAVEMYVMRLAMFNWLVFGIFLVLAARDPVQYKPIIFYALVLAAAYTVFAPLMGSFVGVAPVYYIIDTAFAFVMFVLLVIFY